MNPPQQTPNRNPRYCRKSPGGFTEKKGRPEYENGPPPTQPIHYENQAGARLDAVGL
jgi:hypothetical protein